MIPRTKEQDRKSIQDLVDLIQYEEKYLRRARNWYNKMTTERELEEDREHLSEMLSDYQEKYNEPFN